mmetsp:Transcript_94242/g.236524  ORF Transcript_94242/g.236524 Transcript_94242/m.236524 type:complete len:517 (-) Transcript_94242:81-1631(-)|eukprot:CAMPEP_0115386160 /NCGR_PEP_ID=MMETSP0271-20121206/8000_1 /TAXON_ID=71861 /ORGANISM="Scrippsiella trochoidea, Strain CCMP3099" /LENGTH=516 /DNA_ID=CAMNT_0002809577 /DNA_START=95 /DNA_END=1645 /DNA_ORIENTATION=+
MTHYECCYSSGRQFVFAEQRRCTLTGLRSVALGGLIIGLGIGVTISLAGIFPFELVMAGIACISAYQAYLFAFRRVSSSVDVWSYVLGNFAFLVLFGMLLAGARFSLQFDLSALNRSVLFSIAGLIVGSVLYTYIRLCLQEDERKHHLGLCTQEGFAIGQPLVTQAAIAEDPAVSSYYEDIVCFIGWVLTWQWWVDLHDFPVSADEECTSADTITVHNHTLKLVKVGFYSPDDVLCWVPFGGISGHGMGFVRAGQCRTFSLRRRGSDPNGGFYQLKVFQPGFLDKELASCTRAICGQHFAFSDVESMVKRSRVLSAPPATLGLVRPEAMRPLCDLAALSSESSDDELPEALVRDSGSGTQLRVGGEGALMHRSNRIESFNLSVAGHGGGLGAAVGAEDSSTSPVKSRSSIEARRASPEEVVVRNRSNQEIRVRLFRTNDYCFMVPLASSSCGSRIGELLGWGDLIPPHGELRLDPKHTLDGEFTLKVYSVGPGAKELTYLTASRGSTYFFCDSLLS